MFTEEEAKKKWCPMSRKESYGVSGESTGSYNRDDGNVDCIASDCMMWRWKEAAMDVSGEGFCGLAGKD